METIDFLQVTHRLETSKKSLSAEMKQQLVKVAQSGSSSNFVQAYSIIEIKDPKRLAEIEKNRRCSPLYHTDGCLLSVRSRFI